MSEMFVPSNVCLSCGAENDTLCDAGCTADMKPSTYMRRAVPKGAAGRRGSLRARREEAAKADEPPRLRRALELRGRDETFGRAYEAAKVAWFTRVTTQAEEDSPAACNPIDPNETPTSSTPSVTSTATA